MASRKRDAEPKRSTYSYGEEKVTVVTLGHVAHILLKIAIVVLLVLVAIYGIKNAYAFGHSIFTLEHETAVSGKPLMTTEITILEGMSAQEVGDRLQADGIIADAQVFYVQYLIYGYEFVPGTYKVSNELSIEEILVLLSTEVKETS